jgi:hypothetical protein
VRCDARRSYFTPPLLQDRKQAAEADDTFFEVQAAGGTRGDEGAQPQLLLWSLKAKFVQCSVILLESDKTAWPRDWWLSPVKISAPEELQGPEPPPASFGMDAAVPGVVGDHLHLLFNNLVMHVHQSSTSSELSISAGHAQLFELLLMRPSQEPVVDSASELRLRRPPRPLFSSRCVAGFVSHRSDPADALMDSFVRSAGHTEHPDVTIRMQQWLASSPQRVNVAAGRQPVRDTTLLQLRPMIVDLDLLFTTRIQALAAAVSRESAEDADDDDASSVATDPHSPLSDAAATAPTALEIQGSSIYLVLSFRDRSKGDHTDSRGRMRWERIALEVSNVAATTASNSNRAGSEWRVGFEELSLFLLERDSKKRIGRAGALLVDGHSAPPFVTILTRAPAAALQPGRDKDAFVPFSLGIPGPEGVDGARTAANGPPTTSFEVFFSGLPSFRAWDDEGPKAGGATAPGAQRSFEESCVLASGHVVTLVLPAVALQLSKSEYDKVMLLYDLALSDEEPPAPTAEAGPEERDLFEAKYGSAHASEVLDASGPAVAPVFRAPAASGDDHSSGSETDDEDALRGPSDGLGAFDPTRSVQFRSVEFPMPRAAPEPAGSDSLLESGGSELFHSVVAAPLIPLPPLANEPRPPPGLAPAAPARQQPAALQGSLVTDDVFHSIVSAPPNETLASPLGESRLLPAAPASSPVDGQRQLALVAVKPPARAAPKRQDAKRPSAFQHLMALRFTVLEASVCLSEDSDALNPQSFYADVAGINMLQVVMLNGKPTTYISVSATDLTAREYKQVGHARLLGGRTLLASSRSSPPTLSARRRLPSPFCSRLSTYLSTRRPALCRPTPAASPRCAAAHPSRPDRSRSFCACPSWRRCMSASRSCSRCSNTCYAPTSSSHKSRPSGSETSSPCSMCARSRCNSWSSRSGAPSCWRSSRPLLPHQHRLRWRRPPRPRRCPPRANQAAPARRACPRRRL